MHRLTRVLMQTTFVMCQEERSLFINGLGFLNVCMSENTENMLSIFFINIFKQNSQMKKVRISENRQLSWLWYTARVAQTTKVVEDSDIPAITSFFVLFIHYFSCARCGSPNHK